MKMTSKDELHPQLGMRLQLGIYFSKLDLYKINNNLILKKTK